MPSPGPDPLADPVGDPLADPLGATGDLERADARGPRGFGASRPGAAGTLLVLVLLVLLFQRQLLRIVTGESGAGRRISRASTAESPRPPTLPPPGRASSQRRHRSASAIVGEPTGCEVVSSIPGEDPWPRRR